ncbi:hypothetical protein IMZ48_05695 [Candidatus Bathyarchaeota archaeon]|nr:hypothetical protein [Candidatus Bathyarchaeota archaeon]
MVFKILHCITNCCRSSTKWTRYFREENWRAKRTGKTLKSLGGDLGDFGVIY